MQNWSIIRNTKDCRKNNTNPLKFAAEIIESRPPWIPNDMKANDLDKAAEALMKGFNPNDPKTHPSLLMHHTKFGTLKNPLRSSDPGPFRDHGLQSSKRRSDHRALKVCSSVLYITY